MLATIQGQFLLAASEDHGGNPWHAEQAGGYTLTHCPTIPVVGIRDARGEAVGWLIGWPIDPTGDIADGLDIGAAVAAGRFVSAVEEAVYRLSGRFAVVIAVGEPRVYLDPAGQLAVVYNPEERVVASSLGLAARRPTPDAALVRAFDIPNRDSWFPFGLTPDRSVRRLLPNHYLDLTAFRPIRHHHYADDTYGAAADPRAQSGLIAATLRANIAAVATMRPARMSLTAGRDSRMLLAAARPYVAAIEFYTQRIPDASAELDCSIGTLLADRCKLNYKVVEWQEASDEELAEWLRLTGHCVAGRTWRAVRTLRQLEPTRLTMPGLAGEVGRAFYWRDGDIDARGITPQEVLSRIQCPSTRDTLDAATHWLDELPCQLRTNILDHLYIEQRLGCWAGPSHYGHYTQPRTIPLADRRIFALMTGLPCQYRREDRMAEDAIRSQWPELLDVPFNRAAPASMPRRLLRFLKATVRRVVGRSC